MDYKVRSLETSVSVGGINGWNPRSHVPELKEWSDVGSVTYSQQETSLTLGLLSSIPKEPDFSLGYLLELTLYSQWLTSRLRYPRSQDFPLDPTGGTLGDGGHRQSTRGMSMNGMG